MRDMANNITKEHAEKIADKLEAVIESGAKHNLAKIYYNNKKVAQYGIQRGSKKDALHTYIPGQIHVSKKDCLLLAQCPLSRAGWVNILKDKGVIEKDENEEG